MENEPAILSSIVWGIAIWGGDVYSKFGARWQWIHNVAVASQFLFSPNFVLSQTLLELRQNFHLFPAMESLDFLSWPRDLQSSQGLPRTLRLSHSLAWLLEMQKINPYSPAGVQYWQWCHCPISSSAKILEKSKSVPTFENHCLRSYCASKLWKFHYCPYPNMWWIWIWLFFLSGMATSPFHNWLVLSDWAAKCVQHVKGVGWSNQIVSTSPIG